MFPAFIGVEGVLIVGFVLLLLSLAVRFVIRGVRSSGDHGGTYFWSDGGSDGGGFDSGDCGGGDGGGCGGD